MPRYSHLYKLVRKLKRIKKDKKLIKKVSKKRKRKEPLNFLKSDFQILLRDTIIIFRTEVYFFG
ncbi:MAG: hypothetical protein MRERC_5c040 [Mycoplasmataceae bacterium RC_NB112A]|nr:MAG: hypothetical protein MRERC_5c040 [Mycoplasmataceae bacterium RC_NB112A]